ncbi:TPA: ribonuclease HIII [Streptococcus agalactiae]|nr:ribonuclease HIII [Streptococcus agalactiae]HEO2235925.1 ribonuclease HIII [Streptococcus agalactiae]HEO3359988.1 ribonuclease HIII [Streptococcus agalactiae]HEO5591621.1 ribonuclease HIII [Streptococcus agalactiae]
MNTIVMQADKKLQEKIRTDLAQHHISNNNPYVVFSAKISGATVLLYTSGKLVFQGSNASHIAKKYGFIEQKESCSSESQDIPIIGTDEVGNGSYFGGLAVVASFVTPKDHAYLKKLGVGDSKTLTDQKIKQIAPLLEKAIPHKALLLSPQKYNQVVSPNNKHNAVSVKVALHNQAIFLLLQDGFEPEKIVIDAFTSSKNYQNYLKNEKNQFKQTITLEEKAENKYLAVAVSSIIARNLFLENLNKLSDDVGYKLPSGAGHQSDKVASQLLKAYGISSLEHCAKLHFANTKKAQALLK